MKAALGNGCWMQFVLRTFGFFARAFKSGVAACAKTVAVSAAVVTLAGCSMTGKGLDDVSVGAIAVVDETAAVSPDPFSSPADAVGAERDRLLDEDTIRNAVTSANIAGKSEAALHWANQSTGSRGVITSIGQRKVAGQTCRSFQATREAYDGVTLYQGDLCLDRRTGWWTRMLAPFKGGNA